MLVAVAFVPVVKICKVDHEFDNPFILSKLTKVIGNRSSSSLPERRSEAERHLNAAGVVAALAIFLRRGVVQWHQWVPSECPPDVLGGCEYDGDCADAQLPIFGLNAGFLACIYAVSPD
jgi:hypothetical protein